MKAWLVALMLARAVDAATTCQALSRGAVEANPLLPNSCVGAGSVQAGLALGQGWALYALSREHPRIAKVLAAATITIEVGSAVRNARTR